MWPVAGKEIDAARFSPLQPAEVLYDFDGPRTFTYSDQEGELCLAHWCDADRDIDRYLVVPFSRRLADSLKSGQLPLRDALDQPRLWVIDVERAGAIRKAWRVDPADLPADVLPQPGTLLLRSLETKLGARTA
jgi:hypothetical protein